MTPTNVLYEEKKIYQSHGPTLARSAATLASASGFPAQQKVEGENGNGYLEPQGQPFF